MDNVLYAGYRFVQALSDIWLVTAARVETVETTDKITNKESVEPDKTLTKFGYIDQKKQLDLDPVPLVNRAREMVNACTITEEIHKQVLSNKIIAPILDYALIILSTASITTTLGIAAGLHKGKVIHTGDYVTGATIACEALANLLKDKSGKYAETTLQLMYELFQRTSADSNSKSN